MTYSTIVRRGKGKERGLVLDPFDDVALNEFLDNPNNWKQVLNLDDPEKLKRIRERLNEIIKQYDQDVFLYSLAAYLEGNNPPLSFHRRLRKDHHYRAFVNWLTNSERRREKAAQLIRHFLSHRLCNHCGREVNPNELKQIQQIDWEAFAVNESN